MISTGRSLGCNASVSWPQFESGARGKPEQAPFSLALSRPVQPQAKERKNMKPYLLISVPAAFLLAILGAWCEAAPEETDARLWIQDTLKEDITCGPIIGLAFSADGKMLFAACWGDSTVRFWDVARRKNTRVLHHAPSAAVLRGMALSPDGKLVASCGSNKKV